MGEGRKRKQKHFLSGKSYTCTGVLASIASSADVLVYDTCRRMSNTGFAPKTVTRAHGDGGPAPAPPPVKASTRMCSRLMDASLKRFLRNDELRGGRGRGGGEGAGGEKQKRET